MSLEYHADKGRVLFTLWILLTWLIQSTTVVAAEPKEASKGVACRSLQSVRTEHPPVIDGDLSDPAWQKAVVSSNMTQAYPHPATPASFPTEIRVLHDDEALYISAHCSDPEPDKILARVTRRDRMIESDQFEVDIDSRHQKRDAFFFIVNAAGVKVDGVWFNEKEMDSDWDGVWDAKTRITPDGWDLEIKIPFHLLRFKSGTDVVFGINFERHISRLNESDHWQFVPPESGRWVSKFGTLTDLDLTTSPVYLEFAPFAVGKLTVDNGEFYHDGTFPLDAGLDGKIGLGSDFMLTLTANPDFGQVEVDQVVLNLSTIETYFPEKRPFFLEDKTLFQQGQFGDLPQAELFYTRRVGRQARYPSVEDGEEIIGEPHPVRIYGAAKLAGNLDRLSIGLLQAFTAPQSIKVKLPDGSEKMRLAEPFASYSIFRLKQGFGDHSAIGAMATALATRDEGTSITGGTDLQMELVKGQYQFEFNTQFSYLGPRRFSWQDDFTKNALEKDGPFGYGGSVNFRRVSGKNFTGGVGGLYRSTNLALNDVGYMDRPDLFIAYAFINYRHLDPIGFFNRFYLNANGWLYRNTSMLNLGDGGNINGQAMLKNNWMFGADVGFHPGRCDDRETRSNGKVPICSTTYMADTGIWLSTDQSKPFYTMINFDANTTERGFFVGAEISISVNPTAWLQLELVPGYFRSTGRVSWVDTVSDLDGQRFVFGDRHMEFWDVTLRGTLTFTPELTLQAYSQVFLAAVDYRDKWVSPVSPRGILYLDELIETSNVGDDYDFSSASMNVSCVLRWEFLPGSVAYLVYTGALGDSMGRPEFRFSKLLDGIDSDTHHVLMLKVSYFWN